MVNAGVGGMHHRRPCIFHHDGDKATKNKKSFYLFAMTSCTTSCPIVFVCFHTHA